MDSHPRWWNQPLLEGFAITPARILIALAVLVAGILLSRLVARLFGRSAGGRLLDPGTRYALARLLNYALVIVSGGLALGALGLDLGSVAVVAGALGIGVGLGLQNITANFVSGLILLFERPIRPGDRVSLGTLDIATTQQVNGYVRAIRLRSTTIQTPDNIMLIVPNAELVSQTIVNWSHGDPKMRIRLGVGVAYASDLDRVREVMLAAAAAHPETLDDPVPEVRLVATSDSSLDFQLLVWIPDPRERGRIESALRLDIVKRFRAADVTIPFPQREVKVLAEAGAQPAERPGA